MSKVIYKYPLEVEDSQSIKMPIGAKILCVQTQSETPCIWAEVNPDAETEHVYFEVFGTGQEMPLLPFGGREHIGTFQLLSGNLVYHLYKYDGI